MCSLIAVAIGVFGLGQLPLSERAPDTSGQVVHLEARRVVSSPEETLARDEAVLRADGAVLRADEIRWDPVHRRASARGRVTLALAKGGLYAAVADGVVLVIESGSITEVFVEQGVIMEKTRTTSDQLLSARTQDELWALGATSITLSGNHLKRTGTAEWEVDDVALTPCDCNPRNPSWRVEASSATVDLEGEHVSLTFPTVFVKSVPVFWLPWIDLPLSSRRTGLLVPKPSSTALNGFGLEQPIYVTLGDSYDVTFTPGYFTGSPDPSVGIRGPRLVTEFRYLPSTRTSGRATLGLVYDLKPRRDPVHRGLRSTRPEARGLRAEGSLQHRQDLGGGWFDQVAASFVSDGYYVGDVTADVLAREQQYLSSSASLFHRGENHLASLDVVLRQDLKWGFSLLGGDRSLPSLALPLPDVPIAGPAVFQRLPALTWVIPETPIFGRLHAGLRAELVRHAPILGRTGDEGTAANEGRPWIERDGRRVALPTSCLEERLFWPEAPRPASCPAEVGLPVEVGQGDGVFQPGEREARARLDLRPTVSLPLRLGRFAEVTPYAAYRQDVYLGEVTGRVTHRGYPLGGLAVQSELVRVFDRGPDAISHVMTPFLDLKYIPRVFGVDPAPYDELDAAISGRGGPLLQLAAEVRQRLSRNPSGVQEFVRLDVGQGVDLLAPRSQRWGDTYARLLAARGPFRLSALGRYDLLRQRLTQVSASAALETGRYALVATYDNLFSEGSERIRRGIDLLVGPPPEGFRFGNAEQLSLDAHGRLSDGLQLHYNALIARSAFPPGDPPPTALALVQHLLGLTYAPACDCWRLEVHAVHRPTVDQFWRFDFGFNVTISNFGTFGAGG